MKTEIFNSFADFIKRPDKSVNGVSPAFAKRHPNYEDQNATNNGCWNCYRCSDCYNCSYCSDCYRCYNCSYCSHCYRCSDCYNCSRCSDCSYCSDCSDCSDCSYCSDCYNCSGKNEKHNVPEIKNIHQSVFAAASADGSLDMSAWHTCETTHCRAGWVVHLAGKDGYELESKTSTCFAAMKIYKASSNIKVSPAMFFVSNEESLKDMARCAELEKNS